MMKHLKFLTTSLFLLISVGINAEKVTVSATEFKPGGTIDISVSLENTGLVSGYTMRLYLPEGFNLVHDEKTDCFVYDFSERHGKDYTMTLKKAADGSFLFVVYSEKSGDVVKNQSGLLITTKLSVASTVTTSQQARLTSIAISDTDGKETVLDDVVFDLLKMPTITVTANSYSRQYGDSNPVFEYKTKGGSLGNGTPSVTCKATESSPVGDYDIVVTAGDIKSPNVTYVNGKLTITKAPLTIKAGTYTRKQGEKNPEFNLTFEGFKNNETNAVLTKKPNITCEATSISKPGIYPIIISGADAQNYEIEYIEGELLVEKDQSFGDVNGDGQVNVVDVVCIANTILSRSYDSKADIDHDGYVTAADIVALTRIISGM